MFGRTSADQIEAPAHSNEGQGGCSDNASFTGTYNSSSPSLLPPPSNAQILNITQAAYHFSGVTTIVLNGANMTVTNANFNGGVATSVPFPSNGVVYVSTSSAGCPVTYTPYNPSYTGNAGCGNVYVSGNYYKLADDRERQRHHHQRQHLPDRHRARRDPDRHRAARADRQRLRADLHTP